MAQVYLSQYARRAGIADSASHVIGGVSTPAPLDTYIQYNKNGKFGAEVHFRYVYPIHSFQHGNSTNALGNWSHAEGTATYTGFPNTYSSSILSGAVTLSAEYGNITSSFRTGDFIYLNDYYSDNTSGTTVAKINSTSWDDTSSYVVLDIDNIHATTSFVGSLGTFYIKNLLGNKTAGAYVAHAEGKDTYAMGIGAHSEGSGSYAVGEYSHTEGNSTVALGDYQTVVGQYNIFNTSQSAFIIGDGYARIIASGNIASSPATGSSKFNIYSQFTPLGLFTSSIVTLVSASSSVSETFPIIGVIDKGSSEYELTIDGVLTQNYYDNIDTISVLNITRHNLLFASQSYFQVSASNVYLQGINNDPQQNVITYDPVTGQVYYTSSNALSAVSTPLDIYDDDVFVISSPTRITFTGSGVSASKDGAGVDVYIPEGPNFATADLVFTGNRKHSTNNYSYFLYSDLVGGNDTPFDGIGVSGSYHYLNSSSNVLGTAAGSTDTYTYLEITTQSIDLSFNADPIIPSSYTFTKISASFSSSLTVTKSVFFPGLTSASYPNVVVIDTASGKLYYTSSFGGGTTNLSLSGSDTQVVFYSGSTQISGSPSFTFDYPNAHLYITGSTTLSGSTFLPGINNTAQQNVLTYDPVGGRVYYTSSNALSAVSTPLDIQDDSTPVKSSPTFINFTGSGVSASVNGAGVDVYIPGGGTVSVTGVNGQVVFYSGSNTISGSSNFIFNYTASIPIFNVSGAISASFGPNTVGFYGTASWAQNALTASFITASNVYGPFGSSSINSASYASSSTSASYAGTASLAFTASFITGAGVFGPFGSNSVLSASYASGSTSASYAETASLAYTASFITASNVWGPFGSSSVLSASYASGSTSASYATTSSFAATASAAPSDTYIQYNKNGVLGAEQYFRYIYVSHSLQNGYKTTASGEWSHAEGYSTIASGSYQTVVGQYNIALPSQSAFIIGDGYLESFYTNLFIETYLVGANTIQISSPSPPTIGMFIILTDVSSGISETFEIIKVVSNGGGVYTIDLDGDITQNYIKGADEYSLAIYRRHNLLFASRSWFDVSASNVFFQGLPEASQPNVLVYDSSSGQVYYTSSFGGGGSGTPTSPAPPTNSIQFNNASAFGGSAALTFISSSSEIYLTGSLIISGSTQTIGTASLTGSILITGSANINGTLFFGTSSAQALYTTAKITTVSGINTIYSLQTASYDGAFFDYTLISGTNARAGQIMSIWSGSDIRYTETTTTDIGSTSEFIFSVALTAGSASLQVTGSTGAIIKTIIKSI